MTTKSLLMDDCLILYVDLIGQSKKVESPIECFCKSQVTTDNLFSYSPKVQPFLSIL